MLTLERNRKCEITVFSGLVVISIPFLVCIVFYVMLLTLFHVDPVVKHQSQATTDASFTCILIFVIRLTEICQCKMSLGLPCIKSQYTLGVYKKNVTKVSSLFVYFVALRHHGRYFSHNVPSQLLTLNHLFFRSFRETHFSLKIVLRWIRT